MAKGSQPRSDPITSSLPQRGGNETVHTRSFCPPPEGRFGTDSLAQRINIRYCLRVVYQSARASCSKALSGLTPPWISFRWFPTSIATKVYKKHLLVCRLEAVPRLDSRRVQSVWFVRVSIRWLSRRRVRTHVLRPPHSFQNADEAVGRGFRYGELWVEEKLSRAGKARLLDRGKRL